MVTALKNLEDAKLITYNKQKFIRYKDVKHIRYEKKNEK